MRNDDGEGEQVKKGMDRNTGGGGFHSNFNCLLHVHWFSRRVRKGCPGNLLSNAIYKNRSTAAAAAALIANAALELLKLLVWFATIDRAKWIIYFPIEAATSDGGSFAPPAQYQNMISRR